MMLNSKSIGNKIAQARKKIHFSQADLAQQVSISPQAVGKWERGESLPDITTLNRLAEILGVDLNYFSEDFHSTNTEVKSGESLTEHPAELVPGQQSEKPGRNMSGMSLADSDFSGLKNLHEKFSSSNMQRCLFIGSDLSGLLLNNNNVNGCDFTDSNINNSQIRSSNLSDNKFIHCSLISSGFLTTNISNCDFSDSDLSQNQIKGTNISDSILKQCSLKETRILKSSIGDCDFYGADFTNAAFTSSNFVKNQVANASWNGTSFIDMRIQDIVFDGKIESCSFENCSFYGEVKFQNVLLINTFFKNNKKVKRVQFVNCKADKLTYAFLKSNLADLSGVTLV